MYYKFFVIDISMALNATGCAVERSLSVGVM